MKRIGTLLLGLSMALGATAIFGQYIPQEPPKQEKKKVVKSKNVTNDKDKNERSDKGKGQDKNQKRKAEQPKAQ